jgi:hypothetical protein
LDTLTLPFKLDQHPPKCTVKRADNQGGPNSLLSPAVGWHEKERKSVILSAPAGKAYFVETDPRAEGQASSSKLVS